MSTWEEVHSVTRTAARPVFEHVGDLWQLERLMRFIDSIMSHELARKDSLRTICVAFLVSEMQKSVRAVQNALRPGTDFYIDRGFAGGSIDIVGFTRSNDGLLMQQAKDALTCVHEHLFLWNLQEDNPYRCVWRNYMWTYNRLMRIQE